MPQSVDWSTVSTSPSSLWTGDGPANGYRHGHLERQLTGTFGTGTVRVPRVRIEDEGGKVTEWRSKALPRYKRLTKKAGALVIRPPRDHFRPSVPAVAMGDDPFIRMPLDVGLGCLPVAHQLVLRADAVCFCHRG